MEQYFVDYLERLETLNRDFVATFDDLAPEALDWLPGAEMNSFCILVVHSTASARYWVGDAAMGEPSNRDRDSEFRAHGLTHAQLKTLFTNEEAYVRGVAERLTSADLGVIRPFTNRAGETRQLSIGWSLLHALEHTALHLGHAQITRQLWQYRQALK